MGITISDILSLIAILISLYSICASKKINKLQEKLIELEHELNTILIEKENQEKEKKKKANLGVNKLRLGKGKTILRIYNDGEADAYNIRIIYPEGFKGFVIDDKFPLEKLNSMQRCDLNVILVDGYPSKTLIKLIWDDEHKNDNETEIMVTW